MANLLDDGAAWLAGKLKSHAARSIVYKRGALEVTISEATVSRTVFKFSDPSSGATIRITSRDFLISAADLVLGGAAVTPQRNDVIEETAADGTVYSHTVLPFNDEPFWQWLDNARTVFRVHTKQTGISN